MKEYYCKVNEAPGGETMREIKFRAWVKQDKTMSPPFTLAEGDIIWLQYTGLKDCEGKEIYEGDVMQVEAYATESNPMGEPHLAVASFLHGRFGWHQIYWTGEKSDRFEALFDYTGGAAMSVEAIVIGNIYENPELVKEDNGSS